MAFTYQTISCFIIYGLALLITFLIVTYDMTWCYDDTLLFNNKQFNMVVFAIGMCGIMSLVMGHQPDSFERLKVEYFKLTLFKFC